MIGTIISHYKILEKLGEGGMGIVYKAHDTNLDRTVALKFLPHNLTLTETTAARFLQEAKSAAALNHPNICTIHAIEEVDGETFIVMELVDGETLRERVQGTGFRVQESIGCAIQIAEALTEAHSHKIVHRDVKSENIMVNTKGQIKVMDFGLAKLRDSVHRTKSTSTVGTLAYMAPEQLQGGDADERSDIFSFGVVMYELFTGQLPFKGAHEAAMMYEIVNVDPAPLRSVRPEINPAIERIVMKCLEKDPAKRHQSAHDIASELQSLHHPMSHTAQPVASRQRSNLPWMIAGAFSIIAAVAFLLVKPSTDTLPEASAIQTIAVLPFVDLSPQKDQEYFSDGLAEELLNVLAQNPKLRVTSRTSSFSFKGKNADVRTIAAKLNVKHILEGSVRKSGSRLRITAQLINVETDAHLWSETYDGTMDNIFAVQDTISRSVAGALQVVLLNEKTQKKEVAPEVYNAYLLGKHFNSRQKDLAKAADYFTKALAMDSTFVPAWVELSSIHSLLANEGVIQVDEGYRQARREAEKALAIDPENAEAHSQLGFIRRRYDWDWRGADESYQRALQLDPGDAGVISGAAGLARTLGRFDEALRLMRLAVSLNPVSSTWRFNLGLYSWYAGLLDESQAAFAKCDELNPQFSGLHSAISLVYFEQGRVDSALAVSMRETGPDWRLYAQAIVYHTLHNRKKSDEALAALIEGHATDDAYQIAEVYAYRDEKDKAFEWLERAYAQRDGGLPSIKGNPLLRNINRDPRYAAFLKKLQLPL
ncbi:MAG: protein kinase [Ignavibacteriae bacterium]|nr:protein kinase [Ignavibacteriota bacterium]